MSWFTNYKESKRKTLLGKLLQRVICTWIGKIVFGVALVLIGILPVWAGIVPEYSLAGDIFNYVALTGTGILCLIAVIFIFAGFYYWIKDDILGRNN